MPATGLLESFLSRLGVHALFRILVAARARLAVWGRPPISLRADVTIYWMKWAGWAAILSLAWYCHRQALLSIIWTLFIGSLTTLLLALGLRRERTRLWAVGVGGADAAIVRGRLSYGKALEHCRNEVSLLGTGAGKLTREPAFEQALLRCGPDSELKFLLLEPTAQALTDSARRAGKDREEYRRIVVESLRKLASLHHDRGLRNLQVRFHSGQSPFRLMFIDDRICL